MPHDTYPAGDISLTGDGLHTLSTTLLHLYTGITMEKNTPYLSWIAEQAQMGVTQFDRAMAEAYPEAGDFLGSGQAYLHTVGEACNYIAAAGKIDWAAWLPPKARILDFGCGGGWLSAMLSCQPAAEMVYALDSSRHFLHKLLPSVLQLMGGDSAKITPVEALFSPLLFENDFLDVVVASSAVHHAENLESVFSEIHRVLKPGGLFFVLNETPWRGPRHLISVAAAAVRILRNLALQRYQSLSPSISSSGYLYDPKLGDRDYPLWYWHAAFVRAGFSVESTLNLGIPTVKNGKGRSLVHFICKKK